MFFIKPQTSNERKSVKFPQKKNFKRKFSFTKCNKNTNIESNGYGNLSYEDSVDKAMLKKDPKESPQEKKFKLAKIYLQEIENNLECMEFDGMAKWDLVEKRLKVDYLKQTGNYFATTNSNVNVQVDNISTLTCKEHKKSLTCLCISSDNKLVLTGCKNGIIVKWSIMEMKKLGKIEDKNIKGNILCLSISSNNHFLAVGDKSNDIKIWNLNTFKYIHTMTGHRGPVTALAFRKNTQTLYSASKDKSVKVWCLDNMCYVETMFGHSEIVISIDCLYKEQAITGGEDKTVRLWKIPEEKQLIFNGHTGNVNCVSFISENCFVSGGDDGKLCIWQINKKSPCHCINNAHGCNPNNNQAFWINSVASLVNSDLVASGSEDGFVRLWNLGEYCRNISNLFAIPVSGFVNDLKFTNDGKYLLAAVGLEHKLGRWNVVKSAKNSLVIILLAIVNSLN